MDVDLDSAGDVDKPALIGFDAFTANGTLH
jgi:hypothetical protein